MGETSMSVTAIKINAQDNPEVTSLKSVEPLHSVEQQKKADQETQKTAESPNAREPVTTEDVKEVLESFPLILVSPIYLNCLISGNFYFYSHMSVK